MTIIPYFSSTLWAFGQRGKGGRIPLISPPPPTPIRVLVIELHVRDSYGVTSYSLLAGVISHG